MTGKFERHSLAAILLCVLAGSCIATEFIKKSTTEYGLMCGCKNIFFVKHFETPEPTSGDFAPNTTRDATETYGGTIASNKILTPADGAYSVLSIPDDVAACYMKGRLSRLTGYYKTDKGEYFEISGEYKISGVLHRIQSIRPAGVPHWKQFDYYFDLLGENATPTDVKIKIKSPSADVAVYVDEVRMCTFCDGTIQAEGPKLSSLTISPGVWSQAFRNDEYYYSLTVPEGTNAVTVTASVTGSPAPSLKIRGAAATSGAPVTINLGATESAPIDINVRKTACEQTTYIVNIVREVTIDATLADLRLTTGVLTPAFYRYTTNYQNIVPAGTNSLKVLPVAYEPSSTITVNGQTVVTGTESQTIDISTNKTITVVVTAKDGTTKKTYTVSVVDNVPTIAFSSTTGSGSESVTNSSIPVSINPVPEAGQTMTIAYAVTGGTATGGGVDYTLASGTLSFDASNTSRTIPLTIINDATSEPDETVIITLSNPTGGAVLGSPSTFTYTIINDDQGPVLYVDNKLTTGADDGTSWANAFRGTNALQKALTAASTHTPSATNRVQIWVAKTNSGQAYVPTQAVWNSTGTTRDYSFGLISYVELYGGFSGGSNEIFTDRDYESNTTVISGDLMQNDFTNWQNRSDNVLNVIWGADNSIIDGFTVSGGYADLDIPLNGYNGGGMFNYFVSPTVRNCIFTDNYAYTTQTYNHGQGAGIYNESNTAVIENCTFTGNSGWRAHSIGNFESTNTIRNCSFLNNNGLYSSCVENWGGTVLIENCIFSGNYAQNGATAISNTVSYSGPSNITVKNCSVGQNTSLTTTTGAIHNHNSNASLSVSFYNTVVWGNTANFTNYSCSPTISYCDIQGCGGSSSWNTAFGTDAGGNIDSDPLFSGSSLILQSNSPCIDKGNDANAPSTDRWGQARVDIPGVGTPGTLSDIGANEYQ